MSLSTVPAAARSVSSLAAEFGAAWRERTTRSEILMGDFYGGRPTILKFVPWWGRVLEAGCGLGRYVFYLRRLGYDAYGVEVAPEALAACRDYAREAGEDVEVFHLGDVRALDLPDGSLSCYISLGVVEHFEEGPEGALREAHRVLAPGGVAIVSTPNLWSLEHLAEVVTGGVRRAVRRLVAPRGPAGRPRPARFDQYWFSSRQLARFLRRAGFTVTLRYAEDLRYALHELLRNRGLLSSPASRARLLAIAAALERRPIRALGGLAFVIAVKDGPGGHCFFCGAPRVPPGRLAWTVPVCLSCAREVPRDLLGAYAPGLPGRFAVRERPGGEGEPLAPGGAGDCWGCGAAVVPDPDFGFFGLTRPACAHCRRRPFLRARLILRGLQDQWRPRA